MRTTADYGVQRPSGYSMLAAVATAAAAAAATSQPPRTDPETDSLHSGAGKGQGTQPMYVFK